MSQHNYICVHGHFYQPPRENPWLDEVEVQDSAYPYHDWNERINMECYARNGASRLMDEGKFIKDIINNYSKISFNFGPTLLSWLQKKEPKSYEAIIEADKISQKSFSGHGSALAQVYNHIIMPLANHRDKETQIIWGIEDFKSRFNRHPEGMWLAETAVDTQTLELLAKHNISFTILAPRQAHEFRRLGDNQWTSASAEGIDPKRPYICNLPSGLKMNIFFYDGPISQAVAFEGLLNNGEGFAQRLLTGFEVTKDKKNQLLHIATDGESYGHHHKFGDMALGYCLYHIENENLAKLTVYGEYLQKNPPEYEVKIVENSSWSCVHGVERWRNDCGCHSGMNPNWHQRWRKPLREALDWLRDQLMGIYEVEMKSFVDDPWDLRNKSIEIILNHDQNHIEDFIKKHVGDHLDESEKIDIIRHLEIQRNALLMYTSCGWFFDEVTGIETTQVMKYAARAIQLAKDYTEHDLENEFIELLEKAESNLKEVQNAAEAYKNYVKPSIVDLQRVGAHYALTSLFEDYPKKTELYCYSVIQKEYEVLEAGRLRIATGVIDVRSNITWKSNSIQFVVLHFGDHNFIAGVKYYSTEHDFKTLVSEIQSAFSQSNIPQVMNIINKYFGSNIYSLWHLFKYEQQKILNQVLQTTTHEIEASFRQIYESHYPLMHIKENVRLALPKTLVTVVEFTLSRDLIEEFESDEVNIERLEKKIDEIKRWSFERDKASIAYAASNRINSLMETFAENSEDYNIIQLVEMMLGSLKKLNLDLDLWRPQNIFFQVSRTLYPTMKKDAPKNEDAQMWITSFESLGNMLQVRVHNG